eukprot:2317087-Lingulodinium_polyedra.AAC.1
MPPDQVGQPAISCHQGPRVLDEFAVLRVFHALRAAIGADARELRREVRKVAFPAAISPRLLQHGHAKPFLHAHRE